MRKLLQTRGSSLAPSRTSTHARETAHVRSSADARETFRAYVTCTRGGDFSRMRDLLRMCGGRRTCALLRTRENLLAFLPISTNVWVLSRLREYLHKRGSHYTSPQTYELAGVLWCLRELRMRVNLLAHARPSAHAREPSCLRKLLQKRESFRACASIWSREGAFSRMRNLLRKRRRFFAHG